MEKIEKFNQIIDEAYLNYSKNHFKIWEPGMDYDSKESFINKIKTDSEFSQDYGLTIEERELSLRERFRLIGYSEKFYFIVEKAIQEQGEEFLKMKLNDAKIPTKLITLTYKNKKIESYE